MRASFFAFVFFVLCASGLVACAALFNPNAAPSAAQGAAPSSNAIQAPTASPAMWQMQATADAAATTAASYATAVADAARLTAEAEQAATQQRLATMEAISLTYAAPTVVALELQIKMAEDAATQQAQKTHEADQATKLLATEQAAITATAQVLQAGLNAQVAVMQATEAAKREQNFTNTQNAAGLLDVLWRIALVLLTVVVLVYLREVPRDLWLIARTWLESRARLSKVGPAPVQVVDMPGGHVAWVLVTAVPPAVAPSANPVIDQPTKPTAPPTPPPAAHNSRHPQHLATRPDNAAQALDERVLNLLAVSAQVAGNDGRYIPRYSKLGFDSKARQELTHALWRAGHVSISEKGTFLTNEQTLYSLWCGLKDKKLSLTPITSTALAAPPPEEGETA